MTRPFGNNDKRFSIDDAFEEETDEAIKVYGATGDRSPLSNKYKNGGDYLSSKTYKCTEDTTSRDSDSLIHEYVEATQSMYCWNHPKVRENWKTVCAAVVLLIVGVGLLGMGAFAVAEPENGLQGAVFFVAGMICFVPGAYHVVYIWLAARGQRGYRYSQKHVRRNTLDFLLSVGGISAIIELQVLTVMCCMMTVLVVVRRVRKRRTGPENFQGYKSWLQW